MIPAHGKPICFILDVDGVMTTGQFMYTERGKAMKVFGPDDNDALSLLKSHLEIRFITSDKRGYSITCKRIAEDMGFPLSIVSATNRLGWIKERYSLDKIIYMGDGIFDHYVMREVGYAIAPANADRLAKRHAHYVTVRSGGDRAVAEACIHILGRFFTPYDPNQPLDSHGKTPEAWLA